MSENSSIDWDKFRDLTLRYYREMMVHSQYRDDQLTISTAISNLEGYRKTVEDLINRAEEEELSSLREQYPEDGNPEFWEYFYPVHWQELFKTQFRYSFLVWSMGVIEFNLDKICEDASLIAGEPSCWTNYKNEKRQRRYTTIQKHQKFLSSPPFCFELPNKQRWDWLKNVYELRNILAHNAAVLAGAKNQSKLANIIQMLDGVEDGYFAVEISSDFCIRVVENVKAIFDDLCTEQARLCQEYPKNLDLTQQLTTVATKNTTQMNADEILTAGLEALERELGPVGAIRFLQLFETGSGDYTVDRHAWQDSMTVEQIVALIKKQDQN